jgi:hypothetical protein
MPPAREIESGGGLCAFAAIGWTGLIGVGQIAAAPHAVRCQPEREGHAFMCGQCDVRGCLPPCRDGTASAAQPMLMAHPVHGDYLTGVTADLQDRPSQKAVQIIKAPVRWRVKPRSRCLRPALRVCAHRP